MNRREALIALLAGIAGATTSDLLVPSRKIFLPPSEGWPVDARVTTMIRAVWPNGIIIASGLRRADLQAALLAAKPGEIVLLPAGGPIEWHEMGLTLPDGVYLRGG